jgi:predicted dehydrogenase
LYTDSVQKTSDSHEFTAAIIGAGRVGRYHAKGQLALGTRVVVYDPSQQSVQALLQEFPDLVVVNSLAEALDMADVVHICTPPMYHLETALESIKRHKPTIVEKPLALNLKEGVEIYRAARDNEVPAILATSFRVGPAFPVIYDRVQGGDIGPITSIETSYVHDVKNLEDGNTWRKQLEGNAFLYEGGSHGVDLNMWMANQPVVELEAIVGSKKTREEYKWVEDFGINLRYQDGMLGRVWVSASAPLPRHGSHMAVYGSTGSYRVHSKEGYYESYYEGDSSWTKNSIDESLTMRTMDTMASIFNDYVQGKREDFKPMPDIADGIRLMIVMDAIEKSIASGKLERVPSFEEVLRDIA